MVQAGFTSADGLRKKRRYAILMAFIAAAVLTPPDPLSQIGLAIPIIFLYEVSIICATMIEKRRRARDEALGLVDDDDDEEDDTEEEDSDTKP